jgi:hypothetical protein
MGLLYKEAQLIAASKILCALRKGNALITRVDDQECHLNNPKVYHFRDIQGSVLWCGIFHVRRELLRDSLDRLIQNRHVEVKILNRQNPFDTQFFITERGFQACRESEYSRMILASVLKGIKPVFAFIAGVASTLLVDFLKRKFLW